MIGGFSLSGLGSSRWRESDRLKPNLSCLAGK
jgi:hypothetical protein